MTKPPPKTGKNSTNNQPTCSHPTGKNRKNLIKSKVESRYSKKVTNLTQTTINLLKKHQTPQAG